MDVRYQFVIYIMIAVFAILIGLLCIRFKKPVEYTGGKKLANIDYLKNNKYYRAKMVWYRILTSASIVTCMIGFLCSCILVSRPYEEQSYIEEEYSRDIILCIDISTSVDELNSSLVDELKDTVEALQGDRFGIVIFNTSPILLCPLTDDYEYVISELDRIEDCLHTRIRGNYYSSDYYEDCQYLESGTLVGCDSRGSSLIADGLASCAFDFTYTEDEENRSRFIIFSTDNDPMGDSYVTLREAAQLCSDRGIVVYGIGTEEMYDSARNEMKYAVEQTGGLFFLEEQSGSMESIVAQIEASQESLILGDTVVTKIDKIQAPFILLVIAVLLMYIMRRIIRR